jgi:hypothetical protein
VNDLKDLLERALADGHGPARGARADAAGDLARGKRLLRGRTRNRMMGTAAAAAVVAAAAVTVPAAFGGGAAHESAARTPSASQPAATQVKLVAYTGPQPPGYVVKKIPAGWVIQGTNSYNLVIAPANDPDKSPDSFLGKLLVTQEEFSTADAASNGWVPATVGGHAAYYNDGKSAGMAQTAGLVIRQASGQWLLVQAPVSLGWTQGQLTEFARSVTITATATPGKG